MVLVHPTSPHRPQHPPFASRPISVTAPHSTAPGGQHLQAAGAATSRRALALLLLHQGTPSLLYHIVPHRVPLLPAALGPQLLALALCRCCCTPRWPLPTHAGSHMINTSAVRICCCSEVAGFVVRPVWVCDEACRPPGLVQSASEARARCCLLGEAVRQLQRAAHGTRRLRPAYCVAYY